MKKLSLSYFLMLASLFISHKLIASPCDKYIGQCEYYLCQESEYHCGEKGYLIHFGQHYCENFYQNLNHELSPKGQVWIDNVRTCLQNKMESFEASNSCRNLKKQAYRSHSDCYLKANFCQLSFSDKKKIIAFLKPELWKFRTQKEGIQVLYQCLKN